MDKQAVFETLVLDLDLKSTTPRGLIKTVFPMFAKAGRGSLESLTGVTVGQLISHIGDWPPLRLHNYRMSLSDGAWQAASFRDLAMVLKNMGLTSEDWPLLELTASGVCQAHLARARSKKELLQVPAFALEMSTKGFAEVVHEVRQSGDSLLPQTPTAWLEVTIAELLALSPTVIKNGGRSRIHAADVSQSLESTRQKLRSLGFTEDDGPFIYEGNRRATIAETEDGLKKVGLSVELSRGDIEKLIEYFRPGQLDRCS